MAQVTIRVINAPVSVLEWQLGWLPQGATPPPPSLTGPIGLGNPLTTEANGLGNFFLRLMTSTGATDLLYPASGIMAAPTGGSLVYNAATGQMLAPGASGGGIKPIWLIGAGIVAVGLVLVLQPKGRARPVRRTRRRRRTVKALPAPAASGMEG